MEVRYRRELNENFLILEEEEQGDSYAIRILTENKIPGLLELRVHPINQKREYFYEISGKLSLQKYLEKRQITCMDMRRLLFGIGQSLESAEEYLLREEGILLEPEFLYTDVAFSKVWLCYYPSGGQDFYGQVRGLTQYFLNKIDHMEENSVEIAYELFHISSQDFFRFEDLLKALEEEEEPESPLKDSREETYQTEMEWEAEEGLPKELFETKRSSSSFLLPGLGAAAVAAAWGFGILDAFSLEEKAGFLLLAAAGGILLSLLRSPKKADKQISEPEQDAWQEMPPAKPGETRPLEGHFKKMPHAKLLISQNSLRHASITLTKMPYVIGKMEDACDYVLDSPVISRMHARVDQREDGFYLTDLRSTNGTFLNGSRLAANRPYLLKEGDEVILADLKFLFQ